MIHGFIRVAAATPKIKVADCEFNTNRMIEILEECEKEEIKLVVFPELCITGYTCGDLFFQDVLLSSAIEQLKRIAKVTKDMNLLSVVGLPYLYHGNIYNVAAFIKDGQVLGMVPKKNIPNYSEFYEARHFTSGNEEPITISFDDYEIPFGTNILFQCKEMKDLIIGAEICEDVWVTIPPSSNHCLAGATVIANLSASDELIGKDTYRRDLIKGQSARAVCGYIYATAGEGESTTDCVYGGHNILAENGKILSESKRFINECIYTEFDLSKLVSERRRKSTYQAGHRNNYLSVPFSYHGEMSELSLTRKYNKTPFVPLDKDERYFRCEEIILIQAMGLKKRLEHTKIEHAIIGVSGGLDSTLALLVTVKAFELLGLEKKNIIAVTMPCFGTSDRTYKNAISFIKKLGVTLKEIPINEAVLIHFRDIGQDENVHDTTYENAQARERTQVLMDLANQYNGLVIGTGDMSELALGWATYNGDHMSMYGVNSSLPKTVVRYLVLYFARTVLDEELSEILIDILDTPVSPELLPLTKEKKYQKTEDIVGPYELHDFFLYYILRFGYTPTKIYRLAKCAFAGDYDDGTIYKCLTIFYKRFFSQQFKRSCLPDGPKVGTVSLSPRGDFRMPSDACVDGWLKELEKIKIDL